MTRHRITRAAKERERLKKRVLRKNPQTKQADLQRKKAQRREKRILDLRLRSQNEFLQKKNRKLQNKTKELKKKIAEFQSDHPASQSESMQIEQDPGSQNSSNESTQFHEFIVERYLKSPNLYKLIGITRTQFNKLSKESRPVFQQTTLQQEATASTKEKIVGESLSKLTFISL
jgi:hypothetical protein